MFKHVGSRPGIGNPLVDVRIGSQNYLKEIKPDGSKVFWSRKTLNSGCNAVVLKDKRLDGLLYCPKCGEFRRLIEFIEE